MSIYEYYVPVCKNCGKRGMRKAGGPVGSNKKPSSQPNIFGKCPSNALGGKHNPVWEKD